MVIVLPLDPLLDDGAVGAPLVLPIDVVVGKEPRPLEVVEVGAAGELQLARAVAASKVRGRTARAILLLIESPARRPLPSGTGRKRRLLSA
jgi:hypothetical protein